MNDISVPLEEYPHPLSKHVVSAILVGLASTLRFYDETQRTFQKDTFLSELQSQVASQSYHAEPFQDEHLDQIDLFFGYLLALSNETDSLN